MSSVPETAAQTIPVIQVNQEEVHRHLDQVVRDSVEATINALLDAEADHLCGARRYERSAERLDTRAGHYTRKLHTRAGEVELKVPKLRNLPFETAIIERYRRRETSVEEALVEMLPRRRVHPPHRGHHRGLVGHPGQLEHRQRAEQEDLRPDRAVASAAHRGRARLRLPRRHLAEALLGRRGPQRGGAGGGGGQPRRLPRGAG